MSRVPKKHDMIYEEIALKRRWTYIPLCLFTFLGLFFTIAFFQIEDAYGIVFLRLLFIIYDIVVIKLLIAKIIQPPILISYDNTNRERVLKCYRFKRCFNIYLDDISKIDYNDYRFVSVLIIYLKNKKKVFFSGIVNINKVSERLNELR